MVTKDLKNVKPKKPDHPPYSAMITTAIRELNDKKGSSRARILNYIKANFKVGPNATVQTRLSLLRMIKGAAVNQIDGTGVKGRFKLAVAEKKTKSLKKVVTKKQVARMQVKKTKAVTPKKKAPVKKSPKKKTVLKKVKASPKKKTAAKKTRSPAKKKITKAKKTTKAPAKKAATKKKAAKK